LIAWVDGQDARMRQALSLGLTRRDQRLRDLARALPRAETLLETPRQRLDMQGARLAPALASGVQRRKLRLSEIGGSLRPANLARAVAAERRALGDMGSRLGPALTRAVAARRERYAALRRGFRPEVLARECRLKRDRFEDLVRRLSETGARGLRDLGARLDALGRLNETLSYKATLARGFVVVRSDGRVVTHSAEAAAASGLELEFADGRVTVGGPPRPARKAPDKPPGQGSLF
jgi:exodeoxyribonuclease VII large subunit